MNTESEKVLKKIKSILPKTLEVIEIRNDDNITSTNFISFQVRLKHNKFYNGGMISFTDFFYSEIQTALQEFTNGKISFNNTGSIFFFEIKK